MNNKPALIIVEDDPLIALDLADIARDAGFQVEAIHHQAEAAMQTPPVNARLALLDINLGGEIDGTQVGFHFLEKYDIRPVFITSYFDPQTVAKAAKARPLAYILKPYEEADILANLQLAVSRIDEKPVVSSQNKPIFVRLGNKLKRVRPEEVTHLQASDMHTYLYTETGRFLASQSLKELAEMFNPIGFVRVHRSYVVNLKYVDGICEDHLLLVNHEIPLGRTHKKNFLEQILSI